MLESSLYDDEDYLRAAISGGFLLSGLIFVFFMALGFSARYSFFCGNNVFFFAFVGLALFRVFGRKPALAVGLLLVM